MSAGGKKRKRSKIQKKRNPLKLTLWIVNCRRKKCPAKNNPSVQKKGGGENELLAKTL